MNEKTKRKGASVHSRLKRAITKGDVTTLAEIYCHYLIEADTVPDGEALTDGDTWNIAGALDTPEKYSQFNEHVIFFYAMREMTYLMCGCYYMYESAMCGMVALCAKYLHLRAQVEGEQNTEAKVKVETAMGRIESDFDSMIDSIKFARVQYSSIIRGIVEAYGKSRDLWRFIPNGLNSDFDSYKNKSDQVMNVARYMIDGDEGLQTLFHEKIDGLPSLWESEPSKKYMNTAVNTMNLYESGWRKKTE